jgi:hypothetical protein
MAWKAGLLSDTYSMAAVDSFPVVPTSISERLVMTKAAVRGHPMYRPQLVPSLLKDARQTIRNAMISDPSAFLATPS